MKFIYTVLFFALCTSLQAQSISRDCKEIIVSAYESMKSIEEVDGSYVLHYIMKSRLKHNLVQDYTSEFKIVASSDKSYLSTSGIEIYQDSTVTLTIHGDKNLIHITDRISEDWRSSQFNVFGQVQDSILKNMQVISCIDLGNDLRMIRVGFGNRLLNSGAAKEIEYKIEERNHENHVIKSITIIYDDSNGQLESQEIEILESGICDDNRIFKGMAISQVYGNANAIKPEFRQYQIIDQRKMSN